MTKQTTYKDQAKEIKSLASEIIKRANRFSQNTETPYFGDLAWVIEDLKEVLKFLNC